MSHLLETHTKAADLRTNLKMPPRRESPNGFQAAMAVGNTQLIIDPVRMGSPRLNPYSRLLSRFYEPLFLLAALGQTRGEHTPKPPDLGLEHTQRRRFLRNLAYICDFQKGGASCTAIGLEDAETCYRFWVACNRADDQVLGFLSVALSHLKDFSDENSKNAEVDKTKSLIFVNFCLRFAEPRIKSEVQLLYKAIKECSSVSANDKSQKCQCYPLFYQETEVMN